MLFTDSIHSQLGFNSFKIGKIGLQWNWNWIELWAQNRRQFQIFKQNWNQSANHKHIPEEKCEAVDKPIEPWIIFVSGGIGAILLIIADIILIRVIYNLIKMCYSKCYLDRLDFLGVKN